MNVSEIIKEYLKKNGYDGLCDHYNECGCELDDLAPCGGLEYNCEPGHKFYCEETGKPSKDWNIR